MSTLKFEFRPSERQGRYPGSIYIVIIHGSESFRLSTRCKVYSEEWDRHSRTVIVPHYASVRYNYLRTVHGKLEQIYTEYERTVECLAARGDFTMADIRAAFHSRRKSGTLSGFVDLLSSELGESKPRLVRAYRSTMNSVAGYCDGAELKLSQINRGFIEAYESYLNARGLKPNTISFYIRGLRSIYNKAVARNMVIGTANLFRGVYTSVAKTEKRALDARQIARLIALDPGLLDFDFETGKGQLAPEVRDSLAMFLFCFLAQGMSFVDMVHLRRENITGGRIVYKRKKTSQTIVVPVCREMKSILAYFSGRTGSSGYLFPVMGPGGKPSRLRYESALRMQNLRLKKIAALAGIAENISTHVSRHSWATIAKNENVELSVISEALGHNNETTTRIYLDSFTKKVLDKANEKIRRAIKRAV
ncbi:MAG: site-specific integrase [Rikenellaceae bacterium]|nr:site-specific integrase [Rikenellaceae bacterium]